MVAMLSILYTISQDWKCTYYHNLPTLSWVVTHGAF